MQFYDGQSQRDHYVAPTMPHIMISFFIGIIIIQIAFASIVADSSLSS